jgi:hypothetical protein
LGYWSAQINSCGSNPLCTYTQRVNVSAAFFIELEFQKTGSFVYRLYKGGLGRQPNYAEFGPDRRQIPDGPTLEADKQALTLAFVQRPEFVTKYNQANDATTFVNALIGTIQQTSGVDLTSQSQTLISRYQAGSNTNESRALALREAVDNSGFGAAEYNPSFVLMQYYGYLKRDPEQAGYLFWLDVLNNRVPGNYRGMVCAFITSREYQERFGTTVTQNDSNCGNLL